MIASCHSALMMIVQACITTVMTEKRTNFGVICPHYLILHTKVSVTQNGKKRFLAAAMEKQKLSGTNFNFCPI